MTGRTRTAPSEPRKAPISGDELLEKINPTRRTVDTYICLSNTLLDEWETEDAKLRDMRAQELKDSSQRLATPEGGSKAVQAQARKVQKLEKRIADEQIHFVFQNLSPDELSDLHAQHPPRSGDQFDAIAGYNREAVEREQVRMCLVEPTFSDEGWARLKSVIPPGEWQELVNTCNRANGRVAALPKSPLAATLLRGRSGTSSRPRASGE